MISPTSTIVGTPKITARHHHEDTFYGEIVDIVKFYKKRNGYDGPAQDGFLYDGTPLHDESILNQT